MEQIDGISTAIYIIFTIVVIVLFKYILNYIEKNK